MYSGTVKLQTQICVPATLKHFWQEKSFIFSNLPYSSAKFLWAIGDVLSRTNFFSVNCQVILKRLCHRHDQTTETVKPHVSNIEMFSAAVKNNVTTSYILERSSCKHKHVHFATLVHFWQEKSLIFSNLPHSSAHVREISTLFKSKQT